MTAMQKYIADFLLISMDVGSIRVESGMTVFFSGRVGMIALLIGYPL
ncbi:hypothetical protein L2BCAN2_00901 [Chlamydia trachomatis L2b/Canada2]|nr:hypothetical protein [Chlamydia trachomatis]CCP69124.1 hypothetical protein L2BCAN2_00901 [Chlamydia trachomatis L2b/Canada2]